MSNEKKVFFLAPTWDYDPDGGPIQLGNIVTSPKKAANPLNSHLHRQPSEEDLFPPNQKYNFQWSKERHRSGKFGIWSKFLNFISLKLGISRETSDETFYQFKRIETREFMPTVEYLREQLAARMVARYLETGEPVYMITAVKAVYGAKAKEIIAKKTAISAELKAPTNGTTSGASGSVGSGDRTKAAFDSSSPFVFAFRLRKVILRGKNDISTEDHTTGAMFGVAKSQVAELMPFCVEGVAKSDATADAFDLDVGEEVVDDENEECICVVPSRGSVSASRRPSEEEKICSKRIVPGGIGTSLVSWKTGASIIVCLVSSFVAVFVLRGVLTTVIFGNMEG